MDERSIEEKEMDRMMKNFSKKKVNPKPSIPWSERNSQSKTQPPQTQTQTQPEPPQKTTTTPTKAPFKRTPVNREKPKSSGLTIRIKNSAQKAQIKEHDTFTAWANWVLKGSGITISNLTKDLSDGTKLIILAQILMRRDIKYIKNPKLAFHRYENINLAVAALREKIPNLTLSNQDVFDKEQLPQILGFFYQLISNFSYGWGRDEKKKDEGKGKSITEIAYGWVEEIAKMYPSCKGLEPSKNGTKDFKNGELFKAIIHNGLLGTGNEIKLSDYDNKPEKEVITKLLDLGQKHLGIPKFFFVEDIVDEVTPQERLIVPWLLAVKAEVFQNHLPSNERNKSFPMQPKDDHEKPHSLNEGSSKEHNPNLPSEGPPKLNTMDLPLPIPEEEEKNENEHDKLSQEHDHQHDHQHDHEHDHEHDNDHEEEEIKKEGLNETEDMNTSGNTFQKFIATEKEQKEKCKACSKQFQKESIVIVNGELYHEKCFSCSTCSSSFTKYYWSWEGKPYCFDHYQDAAKLFCKKCSKKISDEVVVVAMGSKWHQKCFSCKTCDVDLHEKFYYFEDNMYCDKHYFTVAGDVCGACFEPIKGQLIVEALKKKWHQICFVCTTCHVRFLPDDENAPTVPFYNNDGKPYCSDCDNKLHGVKSEEVCAKCGKVITGSVLQAMKKNWHDSCFVCTMCGDEFTESYVNVSGNPYCSKCADKI